MRVLVILSLLAVTGCSTSMQTKEQEWSQFAYVDPMNLPDYGEIKSLQQPGMY